MTNKTDLRKVFVQLLFSLAIGQVAIKAGDLIVAKASIEDYYYSYIHLLLCVIIIVTSWVGWQNSKSPSNSDIIKDVIHPQFLVLLLDLALVICYFIIVRGAETPIPDTPLSKEYKIHDNIPEASAHIEVLWTLVIFILYAIWDCITKMFIFSYERKEDKLQNAYYTTKRTWNGKGLLIRIWPTFICLLYSYLIFHFADNETSKLKVSIVDGALIFLYITFRILKQKVARKYKLEIAEISENHKKELGLSENGEAIEIHETKYLIKFIIIKVLPIALLILLSYYYFKIG